MNRAKKIKAAIVGIGNCASSLVQGIYFYRDKEPGNAHGLMHWEIGGYRPYDIEVVAAFDIDRRKIGRDLSRAIFAPPNSTAVFCPDVPETGTMVRMGRILDGVSDHMREDRRSPRPGANQSLLPHLIPSLDLFQQLWIHIRYRSLEW